MNITFNLYYTGKNGKAREFAQEMMSSGIVDTVSAEDGNFQNHFGIWKS